MELPPRPGQDRQQLQVAFRPVTGALELAIASTEAPSYPAYVTEVLAAAVERVGDEPADHDTVRQLSVGDRRVLLNQLACLMAGPRFWLSVRCGSCDTPFDLCIDRKALPVKPGGAGYPVTTVATEQGVVQVRVPTGGDQEAIAGGPDDETAEELLLSRCMAGVDVSRLGEQDRARVAAAIDDLAPQIAETVTTDCPSCGETNQVPIPTDPTTWEAGRIFEEIHALARAYGWSEDAIVSLPRSRRTRYLRLGERDGRVPRG
jgi:hypothetical protein